MKKTKLLSVFLALCFTAAVAGCGGDGGLDCDAFCQKGVECSQEVTREQCLQECANYKKIINSQFASAVEACYAKSCAEIKTCVGNAQKTCSGNINSFLDKYCAKIAFCYAGATVEQCKSIMLSNEGAQYMKCLSGYALNTLGNCAQSASCANFDNEWKACAEEKLGMDFSDDDN